MDRGTKLAVHMIGFFLGTITGCYFLHDYNYLITLFCVVAGYLTCFFLNDEKCNHNYTLIHNREIHRVRRGVEYHTGYIKIYECTHCKKMKNEQIEIDD